MAKLKIVLKKGQKVWNTSDTHYGHKNICRGSTEWRLPDGTKPISQTRDFKSLEHMNETIVNNINSVVGEDDILIHAGDWSFGGIENIWKLRSRIICKNVYLVLGNHDHHIENERTLPNCHYSLKDDIIVDGEIPSMYVKDVFGVNARDLFLGVYEKLTLIVTDPVTKRKETVQYDHTPHSSWVDLNKGYPHFHGHTHLPHEKKFSCGRRMDIGIDGHPEFRPYEFFSECIVPVKKLKIESGLSHLDHHVERLTNSK